MKNLCFTLCLLSISFFSGAQEQKVKIHTAQETASKEIVPISAVRLSCNVLGVGVDVQDTTPLKIYTFHHTRENWNLQQDIYNTLQANVPGLTARNTMGISTPIIRMRGSDNTIIMVDGVRYDTSVLNTLNPRDIESIKVSNDPAARIYFLNR